MKKLWSFPSDGAISNTMGIPFRFSMSLASSALLHLGVLALVLLLSRGASSPLPFGVERRGSATVVEISVQKASPTMIRVPKAPSVPAKLEKSPSPSEITKAVATSRAPEISSKTLGTATGVVSQGALGVQDGVAASEKQRYVYELRTLIEGRKVYPSLSQRLGEKGQVVVQFEVNKSGRIDKVVLKRKSLYPRLDEAAVNLIKQISAYKPFPSALTADSLTLEVPLNYQIN